MWIMFGAYVDNIVWDNNWRRWRERGTHMTDVVDYAAETHSMHFWFEAEGMLVDRWSFRRADMRISIMIEVG